MEFVANASISQTTFAGTYQVVITLEVLCGYRATNARERSPEYSAILFALLRVT